MSRALDALLDYRQADEDGVMVLVSRKAVHEVSNEIGRLRKALRGLAMYSAGRLPTKEDLESDAMKNAAAALNPEQE